MNNTSLITVLVRYYRNGWQRWGLIVIESDNVDARVGEALAAAGVRYTAYDWQRYIVNVHA